MNTIKAIIYNFILAWLLDWYISDPEPDAVQCDGGDERAELERLADIIYQDTQAVYERKLADAGWFDEIEKGLSKE